MKKILKKKIKNSSNALRYFSSELIKSYDTIVILNITTGVATGRLCPVPCS